ncbi:type VI secretion system baseplate subunit TssK [Chitinophaga nivalis]|uniref:Type VI secretion system baseplate subunit TssK n=1 Tax=Chitinophaga nivalis TaxID=2991709 RepID=A0ABT3IR80_9BACT|nr:type VI secretion system baseplate subunit TssK [Chitinophaga nivalis]MCW3463843.1 type VI secretion system baseplate subunit TssK [Chitinophaga nivalis]MCW3486467.1 type VI secretion system baseplate subunit TssK [Chitinophaga nivalis]
MAAPLKYFPVNWIDGMKLSRQHFVDTENAMLDLIRDTFACRLHAGNYGLLPAGGADKTSLRCWLAADNQEQWRVKVMICHAVTPGGGRIEIPACATPCPEVIYARDPQDTAAAYYLMIRMDPFNRQPCGEPSPAEDPPRLPFAVPAYQLYIIPASGLIQEQPGYYELVLAKITVTDGSPRLDEHYIPPCHTISAHPVLIDWFDELDQLLGRLELNCVHIVQKIYGKQQQQDVAQVVLYITEKLLQFLGNRITPFRWLALQQSPAQLAEIIVSLARTMKNAIDQRAGAGKEELLNYFAAWGALRQGELDTLLINCANLSYQHQDIQACLQVVGTFVQAIDGLFTGLCQLDYIGRRPDNNIFVKEATAADTEYVKKHTTQKWFFTD